MYKKEYFKLYFHYGYDYNAFKKYLDKPLLGPVENWLDNFDAEAFNRFYEKVSSYNIVTKWDESYPKRLRDIPDPPFALFYSGNYKLLERASVAVVGTRKPDDYGTRHGVLLSESMAKDFVIVSGLASGVDRLAHIGALRAKGKTIGVMANGLDQCYPRENLHLKSSIEKNGLLLSEFLPWESPKKHYFPWRNRIVAGLGDSLLVIQCEVRSGTMTTVNWSLKQGKDVYALVGDITRKMSTGPNYLITLGAIPIVDSENFDISLTSKQSP